ncbi:hypothetical protein AtEden1_Chr1g0031441 [Arabidopsis thaliana]
MDILLSITSIDVKFLLFSIFCTAPNYAFITWLAMDDRLTTCERMEKCNTLMTTLVHFSRNRLRQDNKHHLFFQCSFTRQVCEKLASKRATSRKVTPQFGIKSLYS